MSKASQIQEVEMEEIYATEITEEDYGFVLGPNGELKSIFLPNDTPFKAPKNVSRILKIFGITDIAAVGEDVTIH
jgi:hypothetical protein